MSAKDFELELEKIVRRANKLRAYLAGDATVKKVWRRAHKVRSYSVRGHFALVINTRKK